MLRDKMKKIEPDWHQSYVIHCPDGSCDGMLLQSIYYHEQKCGKCDKLWMEITRFVEVTSLH